MEAVKEWVDLHSTGGRGCPCTCLAVYGEDAILSGGEDGRIALVSPGHPAPVRVLGKSLILIDMQIFFCRVNFLC